MSTCRCIGLLTTVIIASAAAAAEPLRFEYLRLPGAESCPDQRSVERAVAARLGHDPFTSDARKFLRAVLSRDATGFAGELTLHEGDEVLGRRQLESSADDCRELASALELAIAIAVDPQHLTRVSTPSAPAPPAAPSPAPPPPPPPRRSLAPSDAYGAIGGRVSAGLSPLIIPGWVAGAAVRWSHVGIGIEGRADAATNLVLAQGRVTTSTLLGSVIPCAHLGRIAACGIMSAGTLRVTGRISPPVRRDSALLLLAGGRLELELWRFRRLTLRPFVDAQASLSRVAVLSGDEELWVTPPFTGGGGLRLDVSFL